MATQSGKMQWHANYWNDEKHGSAWDNVKEAFRRDFSQTKADFNIKGGKELNQGVDDTVKQAAGKQSIPPGNQPNPQDFEKFEPALSYGFGARTEYGQKFKDWNTDLETQLEDEWDDTKTGMKFEDVKPYVRRGWEYRK